MCLSIDKNRCFFQNRKADAFLKEDFNILSKMRQLYDFEKNINFYQSTGTFEIVKLTRLYGLNKKQRI